MSHASVVSPAYAVSCGGQNLEVGWKADSPNLEGGTFVGHAGQAAIFEAKWSVPDDVTANETYTMTLPPELRVKGTPDSIPAYDETGALVATGRWSGNTITFTYGSYVEVKENVKVSFFQEVTWADSFNTKPDDEDFTGRLQVKDGCGGSTNLNAKFLGTASGDRPAAGKTGYFPFQDMTGYDLGSYSRMGLIEWTIFATGYLEPGSELNFISWEQQDYFVIEDKLPAGQKLICEGAGLVEAPSVVWMSSLNADLGAVPADIATIKCDRATNTFRLTIDLRDSRARGGDHIVAHFFASTDDLTPGATYYNTATSTGSNYAGTQFTDEFAASAQRANYGAEGEGEEGYGDIRLTKEATGLDAQINEKYTFQVTCAGRDPEVVELAAGESITLSRIATGTACKIVEVDIPTIHGVTPTVTYQVNDAEWSDAADVTIPNRSVLHVIARNSYDPKPTDVVVRKLVRTGTAPGMPDAGWSFSAQAAGATVDGFEDRSTGDDGTVAWKLRYDAVRLARVTVTELADSKPGYGFVSAQCTVTDTAGQTRTVDVSGDPVATVSEVAPGSKVACEFVNEKLIGSVSWKKSDQQGTALGGSTWTLSGPGFAKPVTVKDCVDTCEEGEFVDVDPTPGSFTVRGLAVSEEKYFLKEAAAPIGYLIAPDVHEFLISKDALDYRFDKPFANVKAVPPQLPLTGGVGAIVYTIAGTILMILGGALFIAGRRKSA